jgi:hypothetical protein
VAPQKSAAIVGQSFGKGSVELLVIKDGHYAGRRIRLSRTLDVPGNRD